MNDDRLIRIEPVDWFAMDRTATGLAKRDYVLNVIVDGTTGMISFEICKQIFDFRSISDQAHVVHKPREGHSQPGNWKGYNSESVSKGGGSETLGQFRSVFSEELARSGFGEKYELNIRGRLLKFFRE